MVQPSPQAYQRSFHLGLQGCAAVDSLAIMGEERELPAKDPNVSEQHLLSIHGRLRSIDQIDQSLLDGPAIDDSPDEMLVFADCEEEYSRATSRRSEARLVGTRKAPTPTPRSLQRRVHWS